MNPAVWPIALARHAGKLLLADRDDVAGLARLLRGEADGGHLRAAGHRMRHDPCGDRAVLAFEHRPVTVDVVARGMGEHCPAAQVSQHPDILGVGVQRVADREEAAVVGCEVEVLQAELVASGCPPRRDQQVAGDQLVGGVAVSGHPDPSVGWRDGDARCAGAPVDSLVGERLLDGGRDVGVLAGQEPLAAYTTVTRAPKRANICANSQRT